MNRRTVIRNALIVRDDETSEHADISVEGRHIAAIGQVRGLAGDMVVEAGGRRVLPGFIDAHSHADAALFRADVQQALLRQGVTTVITGQDGISYAPGGGVFASQYFASILGPHPTYRGRSVHDLLAAHDETSPVNVAYLAPLGTIRHEVMGYSDRAASAREVGEMRELLRAAIADGAVGASSGLDYAPGRFASDDELADLARTIADSDALYVSHMRGGYESAVGDGIAGVESICAASGTRGHVSHLHGPTDATLDALDQARDRGVDLTFDAYPYRSGCTLLAMAILPPDVVAGSPAAALAHLRDPDRRDFLEREWLPSLSHRPDVGPLWPHQMRLVHLEGPDFAQFTGLTLASAAAAAGTSPARFVVDALIGSSMNVSIVMSVPDPRPRSALEPLFRDRRHMVGSDGIYVGDHPHPRGWGTFMRCLERYVMRERVWSWADAQFHLSQHAANRFGLGARGRVREGYVADLVVIDPERIMDDTDYDSPTRLAQGIDEVLVGGRVVLRGGRLTGMHSGIAIRRPPSGQRISAS